MSYTQDAATVQPVSWSSSVYPGQNQGCCKGVKRHCSARLRQSRSSMPLSVLLVSLCIGGCRMCPPAHPACCWYLRPRAQEGKHWLTLPLWVSHQENPAQGRFKDTKEQTVLVFFERSSDASPCWTSSMHITVQAHSDSSLHGFRCAAPSCTWWLTVTCDGQQVLTATLGWVFSLFLPFTNALQILNPMAAVSGCTRLQSTDKRSAILSVLCEPSRAMHCALWLPVCQKPASRQEYQPSGGLVSVWTKLIHNLLQIQQCILYMTFVEQRRKVATNAQHYVSLICLLGRGQQTFQEVCALLFTAPDVWYSSLSCPQPREQQKKLHIWYIYF